MRPRPLLLGPLLVVALWPASARAHGLFGHVHVTGWAIDTLPSGELRELLTEPEMRSAALMGASFPDTGYAPVAEADRPRARAYGETAHWEPFIQDFVEHVRATYAPPYDTREERLVIAFLLGAASHGLQDELFDSTFLHECEQRDMGSQEATDPGTDGFLVQDGYAWMYPGEFVPFDDLIVIYEPLAEEIDEPLMARGIRLVKGGYLNDVLGPSIAISMADRYRDEIPWAASHYVDPSVPGSLRAEIEPTAAYMLALWERLHGREREDDLIIHTWPDPPRRLRESDSESTASWVTLVLGRGVDPVSTMGTFVDASGVDHPFELRGTRWGGTTRIVRFLPEADLAPGETYTVTLEAGARLIDGTTTTMPHAFTFQVECDDPVLCPPVEIDDPSIEPPPTPDAGPRTFPDASPITEEAPPSESTCSCRAAGSARSRWLHVTGFLTLAVLVRLRRARQRARGAPP